MNTKAARLVIALFLCPLLTYCSTSSIVSVPETAHLDKTEYESFDGDHFPFTSWLPKAEPELVIIGVHGISGAALDYNPLAKHVLKNLPNTAVYAAETRGQGNDPIKERRGHIRNRTDWFRDIYVFSSLVKKRHPKAKIVWCGESMGSLIVLHACANAISKKESPCDAIILSSPIVDIREEFPRWKEVAAHVAAAIFPKARVSLEGLSGEDEVRVTKDSVHQDQVSHNPYHIKRHTLRLLSTLGSMIRGAGLASKNLDVPVLVLHGGKDVFSDPKDVEKFAGGFGQQNLVTRKYYPESFHLLFYDHQNDLVINDITKWLRQL